MPERVKTYAAPALELPVSSPKAPTTTVSPDIAVEYPKKSLACASDATSFCC